MRILLVTPTPPDSPHGNGATTRRWATILGDLGHDVQIAQDYDGRPYEALVALHARKSAPAVTAFRAVHPYAPVVVALTGTDLYPDPSAAGVDPTVLVSATRLVVLQPYGTAQLPPTLRDRTRVIVQSVPPIPAETPRTDRFEVAFLAHVRAVKDPLRLAAAVRELPPTSRVQVTHLGGARDDAMAARAAAESRDNPRYVWLGARHRAEALRVLARSRLLALTSTHEGGANVVSEALAAGVPVASSRIPGSVGLLGEDYPGYFPPGDTAALARLLAAAETDRDGVYTAMRERCAALRPMVEPARERAAWRELLTELGQPPDHSPGKA